MKPYQLLGNILHVIEKGIKDNINAPLHLFDENKVDDNAFFGPEFVIVPQFQIILDYVIIIYG
jgi:hypothetical protein